MKSLVDKGKAFGVLLTDLSIAFGSLSHELTIAKLNAFGFSLSALNLMQSYFSERKQRTKMIRACKFWEERLFEVTQGSILGPILFNIFVSNFFLVVQNFFLFCKLCLRQYNFDEVIFSLQESCKKLFKWFTDN